MNEIFYEFKEITSDSLSIKGNIEIVLHFLAKTEEIITLYETNGTTPSTSKLVTARDETTSETISGTTDGSGQIILNLANLASGYTNGSHPVWLRKAGD